MYVISTQAEKSQNYFVISTEAKRSGEISIKRICSIRIETSSTSSSEQEYKRTTESIVEEYREKRKCHFD